MSDKKAPPKLNTKPTLLDLANTVQSLPSEFQEWTLNQFISQEVSKGDFSTLDMSSPRTKTFVHQHSILSAAFDSPQRSEAVRKLTDIYVEGQLAPKQEQQRTHKAPAPTAPKPASTETVLPSHTHTAEAPTIGHFYQNAKNVEETVPPQRALPIWLQSDVVIFNFTNQATALEAMGPNVKSQRTGGNKHVIPKGCHGREFKCMHCSCRWLVVSKVDDLASDSTMLYVKGQEEHQKHNPPTWRDWYEYKLSNPEMWDSSRFSKQPGLPPTIKLELEKFLKIPGKKTRSSCWRVMEKSLHGWHPLFVDQSPEIREYLKTQIGSKYDLLTSKMEIGPSSTSLRESPRDISTYGQLSAFIQEHRMDEELLERMVLDRKWIRRPFQNENEARVFSECLFRLSVIKTPLFHKHVPHRNMIILDFHEVPEDPRWQELHLAPESKHRTGPDTRGRTMVFSSIALLGNVLAAERENWEVSGSTDGTHGMSNTKYTLICFGILGNNKNGSRTFLPIGYGWGEGEREIVALHTFLNIKCAVEKLFGIQNMQFKGGIISDHAHALVNSLKAAFPESKTLQCYTHIARKFMSPKNRKQNGAYLSHSVTKDSGWLYNQARRDINRLHRCKTREQFFMYADLMEAAWTDKGEVLMFRTFASQYIDNEDFHRWWYTASGVPGHVPDNNPHECHNHLVKGGVDFDGYAQGGRSMTNTVWTEFPSLIYSASEAKCQLSLSEPLLDYKLMCSDGVLYNFFREFDFEKNRCRYGDGYVCCGPADLDHTVTEEDILLMEASLRGEFEKDYTKREELINRTEKFHVIFQKEDVKTRAKIWTCDCYEYYTYKWCRVTAAHQYKDRLEVDAAKLPGGRRATKKKSRKEVETAMIRASLDRKRRQEKNQFSNQHSNCLLPLPVTQEEDGENHDYNEY
jgi:hypothetical protein